MLLPNLNDDNDLKSLMINFFDGKILKKEMLRKHLYDQFTIISQNVRQIVFAPDKAEYWRKIQDLASLSKDSQIIASLEQIVALPDYIEKVIKECVSSTQTFELYIRLKAAEIGSGDGVKDYYMAMKIRNDQMLAYLYIFSEATDNLHNCLLYLPQEVLSHPNFLYFGSKSVDTRVYEISQKLYETRLKLNLI